MARNISKNACRIAVVAVLFLAPWISALACTSMLVPAKSSATGRPLMWKHRDTGTEQNFIARVDGAKGEIGYVGLFNGGDSLLAEAWMGMNDAGFAIMNTASYNLAPDTAKFKDQEGMVMARALKNCMTVDDFERLLERLLKPLGVQANFGIMDAQGGMAYIECDDYKWTRFDIGEQPFMIRTNYSYTGNDTDGYGYIRYQNALDILDEECATGTFTPEAFTEKASRSFWHSKLKKDCEKQPQRWVVDQDFIPRNISSASIVIEGANSWAEVPQMVMWTMIGYPPCSWVQPVTLCNIPAGLLPQGPKWQSADCNEVLRMKRLAFPTRKGNGQKYVDMDYLRRIMPAQRQKSRENYQNYRNK